MTDGADRAHGSVGLRPDIALSWRRAAIAGVDPDSVGDISIADVDRSSRLFTAAEPVLRDLAGQLEDQSLCLMLADRDCRIVYQWSGDRRLRSALESGGVTVGTGLDEQVVGTNGLGTAFEVGRGVSINGAEHYLNALKSFSCYGHPVRHPLTRRIEGALDITARGAATNPLFAPLLARAVTEIEERLVEQARAAERRLFLAFQNATRLRTSPIAVLGADLVLANRSCIDRLGSADPAVLNVFVDEALSQGRISRELDLGTMGRIHVEAERVAGTSDGVLFHVGSRVVKDTFRPGRDPGSAAQSVLVSGEPGTGRSSRARQLAGDQDVVVMDSADAVAGDRGWAARLAGHVARDVPVVIVEDVDVLPDNLCVVTRRAMTTASRTRFILTSCARDELPLPAARLVARCAEQVLLAPLREQKESLPVLIAAMATRMAPGRELALTPRALRALSAQPWPGNLVELRDVVAGLCAMSTSRRIDVDDLPERYRATARTVGRGGRERAERVAIVHALQTASGNKLRAAETLGISRTTLYRRMRALDIPEDARG